MRDEQVQGRTPEPTGSAQPVEGVESQPERWLEQYGDLLMRDALVRLRDRSLASDAVQETLLAALRAVQQGRYDGRGEFLHWLRAILRNKVVDQIRRRARERPFESLDPEGIGASLLFRLTGLPATKPEGWAFDLETALEREEFWGIFESCLSGLNDAQRSAFILKVLDGVETEEVCKILSINANHLGVVLHRARQSLKRCLEARWLVHD